jgi:hypothetical protein
MVPGEYLDRITAGTSPWMLREGTKIEQGVHNGSLPHGGPQPFRYAVWLREVLIVPAL